MSRSWLRMLLRYLGLVIAVGGCHQRPEFTFAPVGGTVTKDGRPLAEVQVVFIGDSDAGAPGPRAGGITDQDGHYRLRTDNSDDGAIVSKHRVCLVDPQTKAETPAEKRRVPLRYERFNETPLRAEVGHEPLVFDIVIP